MRYRKKPETIEAIRYTGDNEQDVAHFVGQLALPHYGNGSQLMIPIGGNTGVMIVNVGSWVTRDDKGVNCMDDAVFTTRYEEDA